MTKRVRSDRRPLDVGPVTPLSADAQETRSRYDEVSRRFARESPQMAWGLGQRPWVPRGLSQRSTGQGDKNTASAGDDNGVTVADSSTGCEADQDPEFTTSTSRNHSVYSKDACLDAQYSAVATSASSDEQTGATASPAPRDTGFDPSCDLEALAMTLLWQNQIQELRYRRAARIHDEEQARSPEHNLTQAVERREPRRHESVDGDGLSRIMSDLGKLGTRLREDARRQLDVISDDNAALALCL